MSDLGFQVQDVASFERDEAHKVRVILWGGDTRIVNEVDFMIARENDYASFERAKHGYSTVQRRANEDLVPFLYRQPILSWGVRRLDGIRVPVTVKGPDLYSTAIEGPDGTVTVEGGMTFATAAEYLAYNPPLPYDEEL